jgi:tetratricopeptide (TPR) repeat protein
MVDTPRIEELKRRVQVDPASIAFAALAEEYRRAGRFEDAIATCQSGLQRHPAYLSARVTLGRALLELGRFDEARQELEHVLRAAPENLAAIRGLAEIHHRRGELPEALEQYRSALQVAKHDTEIEQAVDQISRQVAPAPPAASEPKVAPEAPAAAAPPVLSPPPLRKPIQLVTRTAPPVEPEHQPVMPDPEPVMPDPEPVIPDPVSLMSATEPPAPALAEGSETFHHEPEVMPDPTLVALEGFLAAIRREKDALTASTGLRR